MENLKSSLIFAVFLVLIYGLPATQAQEGGVVVFSKLIEGPVPGDDPWSAQWDQVPPVTFPMSAQVHWEPRLLRATVKAVKVRSLHNGSEVAFLLEYEDPQQDAGDAAGIEFMVGDEKAHFAHGQKMLQVEGGPVNIWFWRDGQTQDMWAKGFGTLRVQDQQDVRGSGSWRDGTWRVVFTRQLETGDEEDVQIAPGEFRQIAFAAWDAANREQGSRKAITSWWYFQAEPPPDQSIWVYTILAVAGAVVFEVVLIRRLRSRKENA